MGKSEEILEQYRDDSKYPNIKEIVFSKADCLLAMEEHTLQFSAEFAEWISDEKYVRYLGSDEQNIDKWYKHYTNPFRNENRKYYTTQELLGFFKTKK